MLQVIVSRLQCDDLSNHPLGFGRKVNWTDDLAIPAGHQMTFKDALHLVSTDVFLKLIVPTWAMGWTARLRRVRLAFEELEVMQVIFDISCLLNLSYLEIHG